MSNDMPDAWINENGKTLSGVEYENYISDDHKKWIIEKHWSNATPLYSMDSPIIQQLIKEAEERQREKCAGAYIDGCYELSEPENSLIFEAILNAGGE